MAVLNAASLVSGGWNHYINGVFNDDTGSLGIQARIILTRDFGKPHQAGATVI